MNSIPKTRKFEYIDLLKILSVIGIMLIHTGTQGLYAFRAEEPGLSRWFYLFISGPVHCSVQMFFMCSGALLLGKQEDYKALFTRRVLKFGVILLIMQAFNYVYLFRDELHVIYLQHFLQVLFSDQFSAHLWYLYAYLAFILMLPLVRKMVAGMEKKDYHYLFAIYLVFRTTDVIQTLIFKDVVVLNPNFTVSFFACVDSVFYPMLGYYLHRHVDAKEFGLRKYLLLAAAAILALLVCCWLTERRCALNSEAYPAFSTYRCLVAAAIFLGLRMFFDRWPCKTRMAALLSTAGSCTFGVYLFENVLRDSTGMLFNLFSSFLPNYFASVLWLTVAAIIGMAAVFVLKKIPIIKKMF